MRLLSALAGAIFGLLEAYTLGFLSSAILSIPIYFLWNWMAPVYFTFLPTVWHALPYWHVFAMVWLVILLSSLIRKD